MTIIMKNNYDNIASRRYYIFYICCRSKCQTYRMECLSTPLYSVSRKTLHTLHHLLDNHRKDVC